MILSKELIDKIDIESLLPYVSPYERNNFVAEAGKEHYRLLAYISTQFGHKHLLDIGTRYGSSAVALSYNIDNTVHTFDIEKCIAHEAELKENIAFFKTNIWESKKIALDFPFICLDVDPHNGTMEMELLNFLAENDYDGLVLLDDISAMWPEMNSMWHQIKVKKHDITHLGHISGTGLVDFGSRTITIL